MATPSPLPRPAAVATNSSEPRRGFFAKAAAVLIGTVVVVCPFLAGTAAFLDPLRPPRRKSDRGQFLRVASLDAVPADGTPRRFQVIAVRRDAWNRYPPGPIGAVYLRRTGKGKEVEAFNETCPHLGCAVSFIPQRDIFQCPCHTSAFNPNNGDVLSGPSPRGLDKLDCEVRTEDGRDEVWVKYEDFYTGRTVQEAKT